MATAPTIKPYIARHPSSGAEFSILEFPEDSGQSFKAGELVMIKLSTGKLQVADDAKLISLANADQGKLVGIALSDASGTEDTPLKKETLPCKKRAPLSNRRFPRLPRGEPPPGPPLLGFTVHSHYLLAMLSTPAP